MSNNYYSQRPRSGLTSGKKSGRSPGEWTDDLLKSLEKWRSRIVRGLLLILGIIAAAVYCWAVSIVFHKFVKTWKQADRQTYSAQLRREEWQRGNQQRGSLIRSGGSLNSDGLRHRLNELRSSKSGGPERRTPKTGGHYAKQ